MAEKKRVLSIQSHVVSGYVGNKAAVFPLQLLGMDVDVINSVHFSNHTGYANGVKGEVLNGEQLSTLLEGLESNNLLGEVGHLLTGYIGSESFLGAVLNVLQTLRKYGQVRFVCDPVLGDHGKFYVPESLVQVYKEKVIPLADVVTPNQFEVEQLTGIQVKSVDDARRACLALHEMGPNLVFITSVIFGDESTIAIIASRRTEGGDEVWRVDCPVVPGYYTGTGDLCAALLLGHTAHAPDNLSVAIQKIVGTMYSVIKRTSELSSETVQSRELKLIQSKAEIENPPQLFSAVQL